MERIQQAKIFSLLSHPIIVNAEKPIINLIAQISKKITQILSRRRSNLCNLNFNLCNRKNDTFSVETIIVNEVVLRWMGVLVFIILMALGAFIKIPLPFTPVPITLQTFFVLLSGAMLGRKFGALSQAGYLLLGVAGMPLFCGTTAGISYLFGPTGGYLFGFIIASFLIGLLLEKDKRFIWVISIFLAATVVIYFFGVVWLMLFLKLNLLKAVLAGVVPFIVADIIKLFAAAAVYEKLKTV